MHQPESIADLVALLLYDTVKPNEAGRLRVRGGAGKMLQLTLGGTLRELRLFLALLFY